MLDINYGYSHYKKHIFNVNENVDTFIHSLSISQKDNIINLYKPLDYLIESPDSLNITDQRLLALKSRIRSILKCLNLVKKRETSGNFKYDYVMISRFDIALLTNIIFE